MSFLLPSLVPCLLCVAYQQIHQSHTVSIVLQVLCKEPTEDDTKEVHRLILKIVAEPLRRANLSTDTAIFCSRVQPNQQELKLWTSTRGGILERLRQPDLLHLPGFNSQMIDLAVKLYGGKHVLQSLTALIIDDTSMDFASALVCTILGLRSALQLHYHALDSIVINKEIETIVRLHRRVESLAAMTPPEAAIPQLDFQPQPTIQTNAAIDVQELNQRTISIPDIDAVLDSTTINLAPLQANSLINLSEDIVNYNLDDLDIEGIF